MDNITKCFVLGEVLSVKDSADNEHAANLTSFAKAPNSPDASSTDPENSHGGGAYTVKTAHQLQLAEFWLCMKCLMKDKTFLCLLLHGSVLHMTTAGLTAFIPKFFETQYRMIAQIAAFVAGIFTTLKVYWISSNIPRLFSKRGEILT